jgi:hypothetical protein
MSNFLSEKIHVFPCGGRTISTANKSIANKSKLLSEENIINIIKSITDNPSYVIGMDESIIKFVIDGYYFELSLDKNNSLKPLYVKLVMNGMSTGDIFRTIQGDDGSSDTSQFLGLDYVTTPPPTSSGYFQILDSEGNIPESSKLKFNHTSLNLTKLDAGEVTLPLNT